MIRIFTYDYLECLNVLTGSEHCKDLRTVIVFPANTNASNVVSSCVGDCNEISKSVIITAFLEIKAVDLVKELDHKIRISQSKRTSRRDLHWSRKPHRKFGGRFGPGIWQ
jgi:hypothetical protein